MNAETLTMFLSLMNFAAYSTGLPVPNTLPEIEMASRCEVNRVMERECDGDMFAAAVFIHEEEKIIFSSEDIDFSTLYGKSVVLHELVHWVQHVAMLEGNIIMADLVNSKHCLNAALEPPAYRAQFEYVRENRRDPWMEIPVSWGSIFQSVSCRPVYEIEG